MLETIAAALLPALATVLLGYIAAWHHDFGREEASVLNRMVLTYALPLAIFVDTISTPRAELINDLPLLVVLAAAVLGVYCLIFLAWRFWLRFSPGESALAALIASTPNGAYVGTAVLGELFGGASGIPIAISALLNSLIVTPVTIVLLSHDQTARPASAILDALKQPVVWVPMLGFAMVLIGVPAPELAAKSLALLGHASAGVALFASGVILSGYAINMSRKVLALVFVKNIAQPALVWAAVFVLGYSNPLLGETVVTTALPVVVLAVMLGMQYRVAEREAASALLLSMLSSLVTLAGFIALTGS